MATDWQVQITTGARLHFGLLCPGQHDHRRFGGCGMMIDHPGWQLQFSVSDVDRVEGMQSARVAGVMNQCRLSLPVDPDIGGCHIRVVEAMPPHQGLGSGTQLGIAVARGISLLSGNETPDLSTTVRIAGRAERSAIGSYGFEQGGFLVDEGKVPTPEMNGRTPGPDHELARLVARLKVPPAWRIILVNPLSRPGLAGEAEQAAFGELADRKCEYVQLRDLLEERVVPALAAQSFAQFADALHQFGYQAGLPFAVIQGDVIAHPQMRNLYSRLCDQGRRGLGQSSWGPGLWILSESQSEADRLAAQLRDDPDCTGCDIRIARPLNRQAAVERSNGQP